MINKKLNNPIFKFISKSNIFNGYKPKVQIRFNSTSNKYKLSKDLYQGLIDGDRFSLSRSITLVESTRQDHQRDARELLAKITSEPNKKHTLRIGLSGSPGVGKSTFIEAFGMHLINTGYRVAVLAVDPSSTKTGGSILGDKTRMYDLSRHDQAYVRPTPSRGTLGGVARNTNEAILLCEAGGYDIILVETVGVGQSETVVSDMVDMFVLLVPPAGGDELQGMKKGIMEMSDMIIVNKSDGDLIPSAQRAQAELISALKFMHPNTMGWESPVIRLSSKDKSGIDSAWDKMNQFDKFISENQIKLKRRGDQQARWMWREVTTLILSRLHGDLEMNQRCQLLEKSVKQGKLTPGQAADKLVHEFLNMDHKEKLEIKSKDIDQLVTNILY